MMGFARHRDGVAVLLGDQERRVVALALGLLEDLDLTAGDDPAAERLSYRAHPDDTDANERFGELTRDLLAEARAEDRHRFSETLRDDVLDPADAEAWMRVVGEARLVLAARLGIIEDGWEEGVDPDGAPPGLLLLHALGQVQDGLVRALLA